MPTPMIKYLLCLLCCGLQTVPLSAQVSLDLNYLKPTGKVGKIFSGGPGVELRFSPNNTIRKFNRAYTVGYYQISPYRDTTNSTYSYTTGSSRSGFAPGYEVFSNFTYITLGSEITYRPLVREAFSPIGYLSVNAYTSHQVTESQSQVLGSTDDLWETGGGAGIGAGAEYELGRHLTTRALVSHFFNFGDTQGYYTYWRTSLGLIYYW